MAKWPAGGSQPAGAYSPGIVAEGRFVYVSGQGPLRDGTLTGTTAGEQTKVALANLAAVLQSAGAGLADVVRCGVFLADLRPFAPMCSAPPRHFPAPPPPPPTLCPPPPP